VTKPVTNFAASARARLFKATKSRQGDFQLTLQRYAAERFLYRLGVSPYRDRFVLKGAMRRERASTTPGGTSET